MAHEWNTLDHSKTPPDLETSLGISLEAGDNLEHQLDQLVQENFSSLMGSEEISLSDLNFSNSVSLQDTCQEPLWQDDVKPAEPAEIDIPPEPITFSNETPKPNTQSCEADTEPALLNTCSLVVYSDVSSCSDTDLDCISNTLLEEIPDANQSVNDQKILEESEVETSNVEKPQFPFDHGDALEESDKESEKNQEESLKQEEGQKPPEEKLESEDNLHGMDCIDQENQCLPESTNPNPDSSTECENGCTLENKEEMDNSKAIPTQNVDTCDEEMKEDCEDTVAPPISSVCPLDLDSDGKEMVCENNEHIEDMDGQGDCQLEGIKEAGGSKSPPQAESEMDFDETVRENEPPGEKAEDTFCITERSSFEFLQSCFGLSEDQKLHLTSSFNHKMDNETKPSVCEDVSLVSQNGESDYVQPAVLANSADEPVTGDHKDSTCEQALPVLKTQEPSYPGNQSESVKAEVRQDSVMNEGANQERVITKVLLSSQKLIKKMQPVVLLRTTGRNAEDGKGYHCAGCQQSAQSLDELVEHYHSKHSTHHVQCCLTCRSYFSNAELAEQHFCEKFTPKVHKSSPRRQLHTKKKSEVYTCKYCLKTFVKKNYFYEHVQKHEVVTPHRCTCCGFYFPNALRLFSHRRKTKCNPLVVEPDKRVKMTSERVPKKATEPLMVTGSDGGMIKLYDCFVKLVEMKEEEQKPQEIKCPVCRKSFKFRAQLNGHLSSHSNEKQFRCDKCKKIFKYSWNLSRHKKEHQSCVPSPGRNLATGGNLAKTYGCPLCDRMFKHSYNRTRHLRTQCLKDYTRLGKGKIGRRYKCPLCSETFSMASNRNRHIKKTCFKQYKINNISKGKVVKETREDAKEDKKENQQLPSHRRTFGIFKCKYCQMLFSHGSSLYRHMKRHRSGQNTEILDAKQLTKLSDEKPSGPEHQAPQKEVSTVENASDPLFCKFCDRIFLSKYALGIHLRLHGGNKPFRCLDCGKSFRRRGQLLTHRSLHKRQIHCSVCKTILPSIADLLKHRQTHVTKGMIQCPDCPMQFKIPSFFLRHVKVHEKKVNEAKSAPTPEENQSTNVNEEEFKCAICQTTFMDSKSLSEHCLTHRPEPSVSKCQFCKRQFQSRAILIRHIRLHTGERPFSCSKCKVRFIRKEVLNLHQEKCTGLRGKPAPAVPKTTPVPEKNDEKNKVKRLICAYCSRIFQSANCLGLHEKAHKANNIFPCSKCGKFYRKRKMKEHQMNCRADKRQTDVFNSDVPNKTRKEIGKNLKDLLKQRCPHCSKCFRFRSQLRKHLKSHLNKKQFACVHCCQEFASSESCLEHEACCDGVLGQINGKNLDETGQKQDASSDESILDDIGAPVEENDEEFKCKFCTKTFTKPQNLRRHILTHTEVKPYRCKTCESCFSRYDRLKLHQTRCRKEGKKQRLEVRIEKISLDHVGTGWQTIVQPENGIFQCKTCSKRFPHRTNLLRHISMVHTASSMKPYLCKRCGNAYSTKKSIRRHSRMEDCRILGESIKSANSSPPAQNVKLANKSSPVQSVKPANTSPRVLSVKLANSSSPVPYGRDASQILQGIQGHYSNKWKFQCEYCPRRFKNDAQLNVHTRLHTGEKPFGCGNCGERFIRRDYLQRHLAKCSASGEGVEKVLCDRCGGLFVQDHLHIHQKNCTVNLKSSDGSQSAASTHSPSKIKGFSCVICSDRFLLFSQLQQHFLTKHRSDGPLQSVNAKYQHMSSTLDIKQEPEDEECAESLASSSQMHGNNSHQNTGVGREETYDCPQCNMRFENSSGLVMHLRAHTTAYFFICKKCDKGFWSKLAFRKHSRKCKGKEMSTKTEPKLDGAESSEIENTLNDTVLVFNKAAETTGTGVLQTKFSCKDHDKGNEEIAGEVPKYQCSECDQTFTDGLMLISHLEDHGREDQESRLGKRHRCHVCPKAFDHAGLLQRHMKAQHQEGSKHTCSECFLSFRYPSELDAHKSRHDPSRPLACGYCPSRFWTAKSLRLHERYSHTPINTLQTKDTNKLYTCPLCNKTYLSKSSYLRHRKAKHPGGENSLGSKSAPDKQPSDNSDSDTSDAGEEGASDDDSDSAPYFPCHVCGKTFLTSEGLEDHQRCHLGEKPFECEECGKCFFQLINLQQHQRTHKSEFQCTLCGKGCISLLALRKHKQSHVKKRPHRCTKCHLSFTGASKLAEHMVTHRDENFPCDLCNKTFSCKSSREEHRKSHTDQEEDLPPLVSATIQSSPSPFSGSPSVSPVHQDLLKDKHHCALCQEQFSTGEQLLEHGCNPSKERPYSCPECNKHFLHGFHLKKHQLSHQLSGPRSFQCNRCHMSFRHRHHFLTHLCSHGDKAQETQDDEKGSTEDASNLNRPKIYKCPICPERFSQALELANHLSVHAHMCNACNKTFATKGELEEHEQSHLSAATQYECTECGNSFLGSETFRQHDCARKKRSSLDRNLASSSSSPAPKKRRTETSLQVISSEDEEEEVDVGEDFYNCPICNKRFTSSASLQEHKKLHGNTHPFKCLVCGKEFSKRKNLTQHQQIHRQQPYQCDVCSESFKTEHSLLYHQKLHDDTRKYKCLLCNKKYNTARDLVKHEKRHQKASMEHRCDMCYKSFALLSQLQKHQESHVGQVVYECTECDKAFAFPDLLEEHQQSHATSPASLPSQPPSQGLF